MSEKQKRFNAARSPKVRTCVCGVVFTCAYHAKCRVCNTGSRAAYLASKKAARQRRAERDGRTLAPSTGTREEQAARVVQRAKDKQLRALFRGLVQVCRRNANEEEARRMGCSVSSLQWARRYYSDPMFRESERIRSRDKKLMSSAMKEAQSDGSLTPAQLVAMFAAAKRCVYCNRKMRSQDKSLDHIVPLSKGGSHSVLNACICCKSCNARKHTKSAAEFMADRQQLPLSVAA